MWANAQRDGRAGEYMWRPLFNAAKFGWRRLLECRAVMLPRRKTRRNPLKFAGVPQTRQQISAVADVHHIIRTYGGGLLFNKFFFPIVDTCLSSEDITRQSCAMVPKWRFFLRPVFAASRVQHISDLHSKFALRPHQVQKYGRHPICGRWD